MKLFINFELTNSTMSSFDAIKTPVNKELQNFELFFRNSMKSKAPLLNIITSYIVRRKGKQMRPMFVFLTAKMLGEINQSTYTAASLIELMHTATLVHDDVVDDSHMRRGFFSINALWKNKIAVLVGDYLLSKGLLLAVENKEYDLLEIVSVAVREMAEGELLQIEKARKLDISEEIYYEIIRKKTAVLLASCTSIAAKSIKADEETINKLWNFGENVGMAFQIKDDIFDFDLNNKTGKPSGNDIKEKKMTLPLIYALNQATVSEKGKIIRLIKNNKLEKKNVERIIDFVKTHGGIDYSEIKMNQYINQANVILDDFPENDAKNALKKLVDYSVQRKK
ncbi:MAG: polyprenyl synthetase family protein [Bacteroidota bacterium]